MTEHEVEGLLLSVVVPAYNEEANIDVLHKRLTSVLTQLQYFKSYEIILVNDGSDDETLIRMKSVAQKDKRVKIVSFVRNFGHDEALFAGISNASGDAVVLIDADLQDPPEVILDFEKEFKNGYDIVYGQRPERKHESWVKKVTSRMFYPFFRSITGVDMPDDVGDFCMMSRKVVAAITRMSERDFFVRGLIYWTGFSKKAVQFVRQERNAGTTKFNYFYLSMAAIDHILSYSVRPFQYLIFASAVGAVFCFLFALLGAVIQADFFIFFGILFLFFTLLFGMGIVGLLVARTLQQVKQRPRFLIAEKINF